jgi:iron(III) transport system substrate-binding protein
MNRVKKSLYLLCALVIEGTVIGILACSSGPKTVELIKTTEVHKIVEVAADPGQLVIYSGRKESLIGPVIQQFEESSGIEVEVKYGSSAPLAALLMEEGEKTPADIFYAQDPGAIGSVENMLKPISTNILMDTITDDDGTTSEVDVVPTWAKSPQGLWTGITGRARVVVYNTAALSEADLPNTMQGFCDTKWKGRIGWAPSNSSFQTMITAMRQEWGEAQTKEWIECIRDNDARVYSKNTPQVEAAAKNEIAVGFVNHYYLYKFVLDAAEGDDFAARNYHPRSGGPGSMVMVSAAGILRTSQNTENAEKFIQFMTSKVAQSYFANSTREYPLVSGVKTHPLITSFGDINKPDISLASLSDLAGSAQMLKDAGVLE